MTLTLTSPAFTAGASIPAKYTCDGANISPPLSWTDVPPGTKSLALIVDDPDAPDPAAPQRTWVHWVVYDIPPEARGLPEGVGPHELPRGARMGLNDWKKPGYGGPCPPIGRHRYFYKLYALDVVPPQLGEPTKAALEKAAQNHVIEHAELVGTYQRAGSR
jgi:Raf kinase inhibitor-like YbhB/YbcL family protein